MAEQERDGLGVAGLGREMKGACSSGGGRRVRVGASLEQRRHYRDGAGAAGEMQGLVVAIPRPRLEVGAGVNEHLGELVGVVHGCPVESRHPIGLWSVDVRSALQQGASGLQLAAHGSVGNRRLFGAGA